MSRAELLAADRRYMTALIRRTRGRCERYECGRTLEQGGCHACSPPAFKPVKPETRRIRRKHVRVR